MSDFIHKPLHEWSFNDLVAYNQGQVLIGIGKGDYQQAVWSATQLALQWKKEVDQYAAKQKEQP